MSQASVLEKILELSEPSVLTHIIKISSQGNGENCRYGKSKEDNKWEILKTFNKS